MINVGLNKNAQKTIFVLYGKLSKKEKKELYDKEGFYCVGDIIEFLELNIQVKE